MAEELAKSIVQAASIMEQKSKMTQIKTLYKDNHTDTFHFGNAWGKSFNDFDDAYNHALELGYIPVEDDHPAYKMISRINNVSRKLVGVFMKAE